MQQKAPYRHFLNAVIFSLILALLIAVFIMIEGKTGSFLLINQHNNSFFDFIFPFITYLGDGIIWVPLILYIIFKKRDYMIPVIAGLIISTLLTHLFKHIIFPDALRPSGMLSNQIHVIPGIQVYRTNSFPSGHTGQAFTMALLLAFIMKKNFFSFFFPLLALLVGYSRVYLSEHFVTDVEAGIFIGIASASLAIWLYHYTRNRKKKIPQL